MLTRGTSPVIDMRHISLVRPLQIENPAGLRKTMCFGGPIYNPSPLSVRAKPWKGWGWGFGLGYSYLVFTSDSVCVCVCVCVCIRACVYWKGWRRGRCRKIEYLCRLEPKLCSVARRYGEPANGRPTSSQRIRSVTRCGLVGQLFF